jgi:ArsR family transcriptional regulator
MIEAHRVLKVGDTFIIVDFQKHSNETMRHRYGDLWLGFEKKEIEDFLTKAKFTLQEYEQIELPNKMSIHIFSSVKEQ